MTAGDSGRWGRRVHATRHYRCRTVVVRYAKQVPLAPASSSSFALYGLTSFGEEFFHWKGPLQLNLPRTSRSDEIFSFTAAFLSRATKPALFLSSRDVSRGTWFPGNAHPGTSTTFPTASAEQRVERAACCCRSTLTMPTISGSGSLSRATRATGTTAEWKAPPVVTGKSRSGARCQQTRPVRELPSAARNKRAQLGRKWRAWDPDVGVFPLFSRLHRRDYLNLRAFILRGTAKCWRRDEAPSEKREFREIRAARARENCTQHDRRDGVFLLQFSHCAIKRFCSSVSTCFALPPTTRQTLRTRQTRTRFTYQGCPKFCSTARRGGRTRRTADPAGTRQTNQSADWRFERTNGELPFPREWAAPRWGWRSRPTTGPRRATRPRARGGHTSNATFSNWRKLRRFGRDVNASTLGRLMIRLSVLHAALMTWATAHALRDTARTRTRRKKRRWTRRRRRRRSCSKECASSAGKDVGQGKRPPVCCVLSARARRITYALGVVNLHKKRRPEERRPRIRAGPHSSRGHQGRSR